MNQVRLFTFIVLASVWSLISLSGFSQEKTQSQIVKIDLYKNQDKVHRNEKLKIAILVEVIAGWHINSETPNDEFLMPTTVVFFPEDNFELTSLRFPEPVLLRNSFSEEPISAYEGKFLIGGIIKIPGDIGSGEHTIPVEFSYQACDDQTCRPPETIKIELVIPVVDDDIPVKEINKDIFSKLKIVNAPD